MKNTSVVITVLLTILLITNLDSNAQNYSPSKYNPVFWLDASVSSSITHSNSKVSSWNDISGHGNHVNQSNTSHQPSYTSGISGIYFDGNDKVLIGHDSLLYGPDTILSLFVVAAPDSGAAKGSVIAKGISTSSADYRIELGQSGYDVCLQDAREWNSGGSVWDHINTFYTYYSKDKEVGYFLNGSEAEIPRKNVAYNPNNTKFSIGGRANNGDNFKGYIYEILMFHQELSYCEAQEIEGYLAHKWGVEPYLISNHSYKSYPFGICNEMEVNIDENSPNGTIIDTITGNYLSSPVTFSDWRIEDGGLYEEMFAIDTNGKLMVFDNTHLDYETASAFNIEVSALVGNTRIYGGIRININDLADGGTTKAHSVLWGQNGELWDPRGRLPDFSFAGYKAGEANYHYVNNTVNVTSFGATPNDSISDHSAIVNAIASIDSGIVFFPPGLYVIDQKITINKDKIVLRGAGNDSLTGTRFYFPFSMADLGASGYMISFRGVNAGPTTPITEEAKTGDRSITVNNPSLFEVGDMVNVMYNGNHPVDGELWDHILNNQNADWPCTIGWSSGNSGLNMYHTVERIEGNIITFKDPLRLDLKLSWTPVIQNRTDYYIQDCGVEHIYMQHKYIPQPPHLNEPGYNAVQFVFSRNCWVNDIGIKDADYGIDFTWSGYGEVKNTTFHGRGAHHGIIFAYSSNCLSDSIHYANYAPFYHSFTSIHKANNTVFSNVTGMSGVVIPIDYHGGTPWAGLSTNIQNKWTFQSSGVYCAGPHAGKQTVYWNMGNGGFKDVPKWDDYQTTLVGEMQIPEKFHPEKGWHENVPNIQPANLYTAQLNRRLNLPPDPNFQANALGNRVKWWERDPARWIVKSVGGNDEYQLFFRETPALTGGRLGEYTVLDSIFTGDVEFSVDARSLERLDTSLNADFALVFNYQDDNNYYFFSANSDSTQSGLYKVVSGTASLISNVNATIKDNAFHRFSIKRSADSIISFVDCMPIDTSIDATFASGKIGLGAINDAVAFDELEFGHIPQPIYYTLNDSTCSNIPYIYDGKTHTNSGQFIHALGCDSIVTLNLTVLPAPIAIITQSQDTLSAPTGFSSYQWLLNGIIIPGANQDSYVTNNQGGYSVIVTNANCSDTSQVLTITGLRELYLNKEVSIYPNPTHGNIFLDGYKEDIAYIAVFNVMGQEVTNQVKIDRVSPNKISINMNELANGIYYIRTKNSSHLVSLKKN